MEISAVIVLYENLRLKKRIICMSKKVRTRFIEDLNQFNKDNFLLDQQYDISVQHYFTTRSAL